MKTLVIAILLAGVLGYQATAQKKTTLKTKKDKASYGIGMSIGKNLVNQSYDVNAELVAQGIKDYLLGHSTSLTEEECDKVVAEYQSEVMAKHQEKNKQLGAANMKEEIGRAHV